MSEDFYELMLKEKELLKMGMKNPLDKSKKEKLKNLLLLYTQKILIAHMTILLSIM